MSVTHYSSTDSGAPVINGTVGSLVNFFDTVLVGSGTAYGSKPKQGWTKLHSGTNKAVYQTADGVAHYRVMHDGSQGAAGGREAVVRGAESATNVDTLVDAFPTTTQVADAACVWRLSSTADATARAWQALATPNLLMLTVDHGGSGSEFYIMGRYSPDSADNAWPYLLNTRANANSVGLYAATNIGCTLLTDAFTGRLFAMRSPEGSIKSPMAAIIGPSVSSNQFGRIGPACPLPSGIINLQKARVLVNRGIVTTNAGASMAGLVPQLWELLHGSLSGVSAGDTFSVPTDASPAQYLIRRLSTFNDPLFVWETTDTWSHG
jgi:hypothetical protein